MTEVVSVSETSVIPDPTPAQEWYVLLSGYGTLWTPVAVLLGRLDALAALTDGVRLTQDEVRRIKSFYSLVPGPALGEGLYIVGQLDAKRQRTPDRRLVRTRGPDGF